MYTFHPASDSIHRALMRFRDSILADDFNISQHANERMVQRGISLAEIIETVRDGQLGRGKVVQDFIGGAFVHKHIVVMVYAPYGDHTARPNIVTVFRDDEAYSPMIEDLISPKVQVKEVVRTVEKTVVKLPTDLSLEELVAIVQERQAAAAKAEQEAKSAKRQELLSRRDDLSNSIERLSAELRDVQSQLLVLGERAVENVGDVFSINGSQRSALCEAAFNDPALSTDGKILVSTTARKHGLTHSLFDRWMRENHNDKRAARGTWMRAA